MHSIILHHSSSAAVAAAVQQQPAAVSIHHRHTAAGAVRACTATASSFHRQLCGKATLSQGRHWQVSKWLVQAGPVDAAPTWTLDQIAGLAFGGLMMAFYFGTPLVDTYIAKQQRRQLGLCEECGGVYDAATCQKANCPLQKGRSS